LTRGYGAFGESVSIPAVSPPDRKPEWVPGRRMLVTSRYGVAGTSIKSGVGPQFDGAADEVGGRVSRA
jgi:hypothetical protein